MISYSQDADEHVQAVVAFADRLRGDGIDCTLDQYQLGAPPEGWPAWAEQQIRQNDFILVVCNAAYLRRFRGEEAPGIGLGASWEGRLLTNLLYHSDARNAKAVPVLLEGGKVEHIPTILQGTYYSVDSERGYHQLLRHLYRRAAVEKPPLGAPPVELADLGEPPSTAQRHNLPATVTALIGRDAELMELTATLAHSRLVTLTGTGGVGKTRLAIELGMRMLEAFPDGVWFIDLARLADPDLLTHTVALTVGVHEVPGQPLRETLLAVLGPKRLLLLLDNCEHLISAVASLADGLLQGCPELRLLATSREPLRIAGEQRYPVVPLPVPPSDAPLSVAAIQAYPALALFVARATAVAPAFRCTAEQVDPIAAICRQLDGIPLAIELAAARVGLLEPAQIASRLTARFRLLTGGSRAALPRQQTLHAAIDWSYQLLDPQEQALFRRLGVFAGRFAFDAVEAVCAEDGTEEFELLDRLASLIDKSLVIATGPAAGCQRYRLLESIRAYARERLDAAGGRDRLGRQLAEYVREAVRQVIAQGDRDEIRWTDQIEADLDNIRAVNEWALIDGRDIVFGAEFVDELWPFWLDTGKFIEAQRLYHRALEHASELNDTLAGRILLGNGVLAWARWTHREARALLERALAVLRPLGDERQISRALNGLAVACDELGEFERAESLYTESLEIARRLGNPRAIATVLMNLGILAETHHFDYERAETLYLDCLRVACEDGDPAQQAHVLRNLAELAARRGHYDLSIAYAEKSLPLLRSLHHKEAVAVSEMLIGTAEIARGQYAAAHVFLREALPALVALNRGAVLASLFVAFAELALAETHDETAAQLIGFAQTLFSAIPQPETVNQRDRAEALVDRVRDRMDGDAFDASLRRGQSLTLQQAADVAAAI
jgi:predicted ATPase